MAYKSIYTWAYEPKVIAEWFRVSKPDGNPRRTSELAIEMAESDPYYDYSVAPGSVAGCSVCTVYYVTKRLICTPEVLTWEYAR